MPRTGLRRLLIHPALLPGLAAVGTGALALMLHLHDPAVPGTYPPCPWLLLTGTHCPGCGTMRAFAALTHGDVVTAWAMNPLFLALIPFLVWSWALAMYRAFVPPPPGGRMPHPAWPWVLTGGILAFWLLRNLPAFDFLAPGGMLPG